MPIWRRSSRWWGGSPRSRAPSPSRSTESWGSRSTACATRARKPADRRAGRRGGLTDPRMDARVDVITLGVEDLERSLAFYREGLGLESPGIVGTEWAGDETTPAGAVA